MIVRAFDQNDISELERIYEKHYTSDFSIDNFNHLIERAFVVEKHGNIICIGGIKPLAEAVLVTDMDKSSFDRVKALRQALNIFGYIARRSNFDSIHAFVNDSEWQKHLLNEGFVKCKGEALILGV